MAFARPCALEKLINSSSQLEPADRDIEIAAQIQGQKLGEVMPKTLQKKAVGLGSEWVLLVEGRERHGSGPEGGGADF
jgi:hypothetical protein